MMDMFIIFLHVIFQLHAWDYWSVLPRYVAVRYVTVRNVTVRYVTVR
jgi:hypothetical protein